MWRPERTSRREGTIMRLALTVVSPATRQVADVLLDADPATPVGEIAAELGRFASAGNVAAPTGAAGPYGAGEYGAGEAGGPGARVLQFPGPRPHGSLAVSMPAPATQ